MSQSFELEGTVHRIFDTQTFPSGFSKREFVLEVQDGKFPQMIKFECLKEKASLLEGVSVGDPVKVAFDIRGSEHNERFYVNLNAWKLTKGDGSGSGGTPAASGSSMDAEFDNTPDDSDEIPF